MKRLFSILITSCIIFTNSLSVFANSSALTRYDMVTKLNSATHANLVLGKQDGFSDIEVNTPFFLETGAAKRKGYVKGYDDGSFDPQGKALRIHLAIAVNNLLQLPTQSKEVQINDIDKIPEWAKEAIQKVVSSNIIALDEKGNFNPNAEITNEEFDIILENINKSKLITRKDEMLKIKSFDGYEVTGRLSVPAKKAKVKKLVIYVHGTGPNTYETKSENKEAGFSFKLTDTFADKFVENDVAYFSYNTRGVSTSDKFPFYEIDNETYKTYTPQNIAKDMTYVIKELKKDKRFEDSEIILFGISEGAIIAPLAVAEYGAEADSLVLIGYPNENMKELLEYQLGGEMSFFNYKLLFDVTGDKITKEQFEANSEVVQNYLQGVKFEQLDINSDGILTLEDFQVLMTPTKEGLFKAIEEDDDKWIQDNMSLMMPPLLTNWFKGHFAIGKTEDFMPKVNIPIYIFHGTNDANCPVQGVYDLEARFEKEGKKNLEVKIYEGYDHSLNYLNWIMGAGSEGIDDVISKIVE